MDTTSARGVRLFALCATLAALTIAAAPIAGAGTGATTQHRRDGNIVTITGGQVRGVAVAGGYAFRGLPYAAPPVGELRWRPPQHPPSWRGVRDASQYAASCPQLSSPFAGPGPFSEDCLYLNVSTPTLRRDARRPVLVWIHGGGFTQDASRNYDGSKLAASGTVVVTIDYRLGALGFLAHPALASRPGGPAGNYGLMDQQAALRWVQRNIGRFGGDPRNVTIAGQSAGGISVLAHLVSRSSRGLFQRAIVQSGSFALTQLPLAGAEAFGQQVAAQVGCSDQTAQCLRNAPVQALLDKFPAAAIPGVVDGKVLTESIGTALAAGRFARVPIINGMNHDEERLFVVALGLAVSNGMFVDATGPITDENYEDLIASTVGAPPERTAEIANEYPPSSYESATVALSTLLSDANFACTALEVDAWTAAHVPTFAYEFDDDSAPPRYAPVGVATHTSEIPYLLDLPTAPIQAPFNPSQEQLATTMRAAWAHFAATGNPSTHAARWPSFGRTGSDLSFVSPQPNIDTAFATRHHCDFWAAG